MAKKGKSTAEIHKEVTERIIESLENGIIPWNKPWKSTGGYRNYISKKPYRGVNPLLLEISSFTNDFSSPFWLTYNQAAELSVKKWLKENKLKDTNENRAKYKKDENSYCGVKKGEKSTTIIFWKTFKIEDSDKLDKNGKPTEKVIPYLKYISVFNTDQTDLEIEIPKVNEDFNPIEEAQSIVDEWEDKPEVKHGGDRAAYFPQHDFVKMPEQTSFIDENHYYKTLYHELVHSTGHKSRTGRVKDWNSFGSDPYAKEELVAELGASILTNYTGIETEDTDKNTEAYIKSWIKRFKEDSKLIISAGSKAQKAVDYILGTKFDE
jgi:antirestriction protein ArdC